MKKSIKREFLYISIIITILSTYMLPCQRISEFQKAFGYPFGWFTVFNDTIGDIIIKSTQVNVLMLFFNIIAWYFLIFFISAIYIKFKQNKELRIN